MSILNVLTKFVGKKSPKSRFNLELSVKIPSGSLCSECVMLIQDVLRTVEDILRYTCRLNEETGTKVDISKLLKQVSHGLPNVSHICKVDKARITFAFSWDGDRKIELIPVIERKKNFVYR